MHEGRELLAQIKVKVMSVVASGKLVEEGVVG